MATNNPAAGTVPTHESQPIPLDTRVHEQLSRATSSPTGLSTQTLHAGRVLLHKLIALRSGSSLPEHDSPGEATVLVLKGRVELRSGTGRWIASAGDMLAIPPTRHSLHALENAAVLLTVAKTN